MLKDYLSKLFAVALCVMATNLMVAQSTFTVNGPSGEVTYNTAAAAFSPTDFSAAGDVVLVDDGTLGCDAITTDVAGKIALIDRGACAFSDKAENAQAAGAIAAVICNNAAGNPFLMIGVPVGDVTIPVVSLDSTNCAAIKMELAAGDVSGSFTEPLDGETIITAIDVTAGTYTAPEISAGFGGSLFGGGTNASWYKYTTTMEGVLTITTCPHDAEGTRLILMPGNNGSDVSLALINGVFLFSQGACANGAGSDLSFIVGAGETYYFQWDDSGGNIGGFDFDIGESDIPMVDVTVSVDMNDVVDPSPDGAYIAGAFNSWTGEPMTDNGDGTYSHTFTSMAGTEVAYKFQNGDGGWETGVDLAACGVDDGFGSFNRAVTPGLAGEEIGLVCFESCLPCPPDVACPNWIMDDFESYDLGPISPQSDDWTTWSPGSAAEDADVIDAGSFSGTQALQINSADPDDLLLLLGDRTAGNFILKWKMYVPTDQGAYYNLQKVEGSPGNEFANEVVFNVDGTGTYNVGGDALDFEYPKDTWFEVFHNVDLDNNINRAWINGAAVAAHPANWQAGSQDGVLQLGGVDFFGFATVNTLYWVDDVLLKEVEPCPANALICDAFDGYDLTAVGPQSPWWVPWDLNEGGAMDVDVTTVQQNSCEQSLYISDDNVDDPVLLLGGQTEGNFHYSMDMYIPAGKVSYWNIQESETPAVAWNLNMHFGNDTGGATAVPGEGVVAETGDVFTYPEDTWFTVEFTADLDNDNLNLWVDGVEVVTGYTFTGNLGAINIFSINADNQVYIDNVYFVELPSLVGNVCGGAIDLNPYTGGGVGNTVSTPLYNNTGFSTEATDPTEGWECFGEPDGAGAAPELNNTQWFTFVGDGETYFIETGECGATDYIDDGDTQMAIYSGTDCNNLTPVACNEDGPNATNGNFIAGLELETVDGETYYMMIDGFNFDGQFLSDGEYCINFTQLTQSTVDVTFTVNMENETVDAAGVFYAGELTSWTGELMTDNGDDTWSITLAVDPSLDSIQWKYQNGVDGWEDSSKLEDCGKGDGFGGFNRILEVPETATVLDPVCFRNCVDCDLVDTRETLIDVDMSIAPNPFSQEAIVTFGLPLNDADATLTTLTGQVARTYVVTGTQLIIEKDELKPGVYFFTVTTDEGVSRAEKLIVQ